MKDSVFERGDKVPITKEEVRAVSLFKLELHNALNLLDVGAGSGSVGIEAAVLCHKLNVVGVEKNAAACEVTIKNKEKFKLKNYTLVEDEAPCGLDEKFDRIFIGGSSGRLEDIIEWSYSLLNPKGIIVLNFIVYENAFTAKTKMNNLEFKDIELVQIMANRSEKLGSYEYLKPINPVFVLKGVK